jgi:hypothetical protein
MHDDLQRLTFDLLDGCVAEFVGKKREKSQDFDAEQRELGLERPPLCSF